MYYGFLDCEMASNCQTLFQTALIITDEDFNILEVISYNIKGVKIEYYVKKLCNLPTDNTSTAFKDVTKAKDAMKVLSRKLLKYPDLVICGKDITGDIRIINKTCVDNNLPEAITDIKFFNMDLVASSKLKTECSKFGYTEVYLRGKLQSLLKLKTIKRVGDYKYDRLNFHNALFDSYATLLVAKEHKHVIATSRLADYRPSKAKKLTSQHSATLT